MTKWFAAYEYHFCNYRPFHVPLDQVFRADENPQGNSY